MRQLLCLILLTTFTAVFGQNQVQKFYYYKSNVYSLTSEQKRSLEKLIDSMASLPVARYEIKGYADSSGTFGDNERLSFNRAKEIEHFLLRNGVNKELVSVTAFGEKQILQDFSQNRRAELVITIGKTAGIAELYKLLREHSQEFYINPNTDTVLVGKSGSIIRIPANALKTKSKSKVKILLDEYLTKSKMLLNDLSTTSADQILESGGMISIFAVQDGDTLDLKLNQNIAIAIPTDTILPEMKLFNGKWDSGTIDWSLDANSFGSNWDGHFDSTGQQGDPFWGAGGGGGGPADYKSDLCDSLSALSDNDLKWSFSFLQKIFYGRKKKDRIIKIKETLKAQRDSCAKAYQIGEEQRKKWEEEMKIRNEIMEKSREKWMKEKEEKIAKALNTNDTTNQISFTEMQYYVYNLSQLGYINCDRFTNFTGQRLNILAGPMGPAMDVKLVFRNIKSIIPGVPNSEGFLFRNIPEGTEATIVGISYENGKPSMFMKDITVSEKTQFIDMKFKEATLDELKKAFEGLDD